MIVELVPFKSQLMNIIKQVYPAIAMTVVLTVLLGIIYPLIITGLAQVMFPAKAGGSLIEKNGKIIGSSLIGQPFSGPGYFHSRPRFGEFDSRRRRRQRALRRRRVLRLAAGRCILVQQH